MKQCDKNKYDLKSVHQQLNISQKDFESFLEYFRISLKKINVSNSLINEIVDQKLKILREFIVNSGTQEKREKKFYELIGGKKAMKKIVLVFYKKLLGDERVNMRFEDKDMKHLIEKLITYFSITLSQK